MSQHLVEWIDEKLATQLMAISRIFDIKLESRFSGEHSRSNKQERSFAIWPETAADSNDPALVSMDYGCHGFGDIQKCVSRLAGVKLDSKLASGLGES